MPLDLCAAQAGQELVSCSSIKTYIRQVLTVEEQNMCAQFDVPFVSLFVCLHGAGTEAALPLASGMAAICSTLLTLLKTGDHMLIQVSPLRAYSSYIRAASGISCSCRLEVIAACAQRVQSAVQRDVVSGGLAMVA